MLNFVGLVSPQFQAPHWNSRPQFTPEIVGIPLQFHFFKTLFLFTLISAYGGDQHKHDYQSRLWEVLICTSLFQTDRQLLSEHFRAGDLSNEGYGL